VPFLDTLTDMSDVSLPLTVPEFEQWGNPANATFYDYMLSYSPYDNVQEGLAYPHMLLTAGASARPGRVNGRVNLGHEPSHTCRPSLGSRRFAEE
jgi:protease II